MGTHDEETFNYFSETHVQCFKHPRHQVTDFKFGDVDLLIVIFSFMVYIHISVREEEGSGTSPLNSVSDGNMCPTENYIQQQQQQ